MNSICYPSNCLDYTAGTYIACAIGYALSGKFCCPLYCLECDCGGCAIYNNGYILNLNNFCYLLIVVHAPMEPAQPAALDAP